MKSMTLRVLGALLALTFGSCVPNVNNNSAQAQMVPPANWSHKVSNINVEVGGEIEVVFNAIIPETYHVYSNDYHCPEFGPLPAVFLYHKNSGFAPVGIAKPYGSVKYFDEVFGCEVAEFHHTAQFRQKIKILSLNPGISGILEYQMCTESGLCVQHEYEFVLTGLNVRGSSLGDSQEASFPSDTQLGVETLPSINNSKSFEPVDSETLKLAQALDGGKINSDGPGAYIEKDSVNYSTYKRFGETDTTSCEIKTTTKSKQSFLWFFVIAFLSGLVALLTPCVFPMIPMTVSFFMKEESRAKAVRTGLLYGASIIAIYVVIGTAVAIIAGPPAANYLSTHWLPNIFFFLIFVVFAASFFGAFELTLPSWLVNKVDKQADKGGMLGVFFMAFTIVLVSFSCTGPIVGSILVEAAGGQFIKPLIGMFGFSLAFAIPFAIFAMFPSLLSGLPQSGGWLNTVKVVLGFIELAFGLKFLSVADQTYHWGILDREVYIGLWIVIFTLMGFYLLGKIKFSHDSDLKHISVPRLFMAILTFTFVVYLGAGLWGAPLKQLSGYLPPMSTHDFNILEKHEVNEGHAGIKPKYGDKLHLPHNLRGYFDYEQGMEVARQIGKPVFLDFTGHGCVNCREVEARVWSDQRIRDKLHNDYVVISLYVDDKTIDFPKDEWYVSKYSGKTIKSLAKKNADIQACFFNANAQPQYALLDNKGDLLQPTINRELNVQTYLSFLNKGETEYKKRVTESKSTTYSSSTQTKM